MSEQLYINGKRKTETKRESNLVSDHV